MEWMGLCSQLKQCDYHNRNICSHSHHTGLRFFVKLSETKQQSEVGVENIASKFYLNISKKFEIMIEKTILNVLLMTAACRKQFKH